MWVSLAALAWTLSFSSSASAGHGSSGGSSGGWRNGGSSGGYRSHRLFGGGSSGGYHSSGGSSGGMRTNGTQSETKTEADTSESTEGSGTTPSQGTSLSTRSAVLLTIIVPADAKLYIEDQPTQLTGTRRQFLSPKLEADKEYIYSLKADVQSNGQTISGKEELRVKAGDHKTVEFAPSPENSSLLVAGRR